MAEAMNGERPTCVLCLGMAGSGKTTLVQRLTSFLSSTNNLPYVVNLDPAVTHVPYPVNIDIRDSVNYREVMREYGLGPNGGIVTSLNLFSTRFDQVMGFLEKRAPQHKYIIFDTPGQIEVFTWSASGSIITETLASTFPTVVLYVMDLVRSVSPGTFMSNMLYACSILYKTKLPFLVVLNKTDIVDHSFVNEWMNDFQVFQEALDQETSYSSNLVRSMSLVLDEFYQSLKTVGLSSLLGTGVSELCGALQQAREEYVRDYFPELQRLKIAKEREAEARAEAQLKQLRKDKGEGETVPLTVGGSGSADRVDSDDLPSEGEELPERVAS